ncbi:hypothetical protein N0V85_006962 [Neurospora sp. IMI 360204]|nr:hypothetical protein N0V85_006962 [Neurospora sp. IMI 360204]
MSVPSRLFKQVTKASMSTNCRMIKRPTIRKERGLMASSNSRWKVFKRPRSPVKGINDTKRTTRATNGITAIVAALTSHADKAYTATAAGRSDPQNVLMIE